MFIFDNRWVYLTLKTPMLCIWWSLFETCLGNGVYLNLATKFLIKLHFRIFHDCSLYGGQRTIWKWLNNVVSASSGIEPPTFWSEATEPTTKNCRSDSLLTLKCKNMSCFYQMTKQSCPSLFTLIIIIILISFKDFYVILIESLCLWWKLNTGSQFYLDTVSQPI